MSAKQALPFPALGSFLTLFISVRFMCLFEIRFCPEPNVDIHAQHPEFGTYGDSAAQLADDARNRLREATQQMREDTGSFYRRESIRELQELMAEIERQGPRGKAPWVGNLMMPVPA